MERIYGIYDKAAEALLNGGGGIKWVMIYPNDAVARRDFTAIARQVEPIKEHPQDYDLIRFATIDLNNAAILPEHRMTVMSAIDALRTDPRQQELPYGESRPPLPSEKAPSATPLGTDENATQQWNG